MLRDYSPCLPTKVTKAPSGDRWIHEIKHDGFRLIARKVEGRVHLYTKQGYDWAERFPLIVNGLLALPAKSIVLDGEVLCFTDGREDFDKLWGQQHNATAQFCAFDLLELEGVDWRREPLLKRKQRLQNLLARGNPGLQYVEHIAGDGQVIFDHACALGFEGIVSKRADQPYKPGRSKDWLKMKNRSHPSIERVREAFERLKRAKPARRR